MSAESKQLFASAQAGEMTPKEFCSRLEEIGVTGLTAMFYIAKAFKLPLEAAKSIVVENEYGSTELWAAQSLLDAEET